MPRDSKKYKNGFDENLSTDHCTHSFFGVSKTFADYLAQEFGKNYNLNVGIFRAGCITGPNHSSAKLHGFLSYLVKSCVVNKTIILLVTKESKLETIFIVMIY